DRWHRRDQYGLRDAFVTVPADVARDFAAAGRVTDHRDVLKIQRLDQRCEIVGIAVHVVPARCLAGSAMATTIVCDDPEALLREEKHLAVPGIGAQWPSVRDRDDRPLA